MGLLGPSGNLEQAATAMDRHLHISRIHNNAVIQRYVTYGGMNNIPTEMDRQTRSLKYDFIIDTTFI